MPKDEGDGLSGEDLFRFQNAYFYVNIQHNLFKTIDLTLSGSLTNFSDFSNSRTV